jgi:hypothetical protein
MHAASLRQLIRHAYRSRTFSHDYAPVEVKKDDALANKEDAVLAANRVDKLSSPASKESSRHVKKLV